MYGAHLMIKDIQMRKTSVILWKKKKISQTFRNLSWNSKYRHYVLAIILESGLLSNVTFSLLSAFPPSFKKESFSVMTCFSFFLFFLVKKYSHLKALYTAGNTVL